MSTSDNYRAFDAWITLLSCLRTSGVTVDFWASARQDWENVPLTNGPYLYAVLVMDDSIAAARLNFGVENSHGSEYARSQKSSTKRKATKKGKKS